jgi:hypothetical protein
MLGEEQDGVLIGFLILLHKVPNCFDQHTLAVDVTGIGAALLPPASGRVGYYRDRQNSAQNMTSRLWMPGFLPLLQTILRPCRIPFQHEHKD